MKHLERSNVQQFTFPLVLIQMSMLMNLKQLATQIPQFFQKW